MKTVIVGGGLIGIATAYALRHRGHDVTVLEREKGPGLGASFANGALLTPSMADPWNAPGTLRVLLSSLGRSTSAMQLRLRAIPSLLRWGVQFLRNSEGHIVERNATSNLQLSLFSLRVMESWGRRLPIHFDLSRRGSLRVFREVGAMEAAAGVAERRVAQGIDYVRLSAQATAALEPALAPIADRLVGAIHYRVDQVGDAFRFCASLAEHVQRLGVNCCFDLPVSSLELRGGRVTAAIADRKRIEGDLFIVAAGSKSAPLLRPIGLSVPVRPVKGYSITFDQSDQQDALRIPVIDDALHAAIVPIGNAIRIVGTAEFAGEDSTLRTDRIERLLALSRDILPAARLDARSARPWCGLRPMSSDGVPIIGATAVPNLMINTGHGHLGWTMAAGSAELLASLVSGDAPECDPAPFSLARFTTGWARNPPLHLGTQQ